MTGTVPSPDEVRERSPMIQLTRLNKKPLVVNSDLIEFIENAPDTVITLVTGEKVVVLESVEEILDRITSFRRRLLPTSFAMLPSPAIVPLKQNHPSDESE
jgi:flagellar protein FlbD